MITLTFCLRRLPGLSAAEFRAYWREKHAPLVEEVAGDLGLRRYEQLHTVETPLNAVLASSRGGPEAYDGVALLSYDSLEAVADAATTPAGRAAGRRLLADERAFIDLARSPIFLAEGLRVL